MQKPIRFTKLGLTQFLLAVVLLTGTMFLPAIGQRGGNNSVSTQVRRVYQQTSSNRTALPGAVARDYSSTTPQVHIRNTIYLSNGSSVAGNATVSVSQLTQEALDPLNGLIYILDTRGQDILLFNTSTLTFEGKINLGYQPYSIAIGARGLHAYLTATSTGILSVINCSNNVIGENISTGSAYSTVGVDSAANLILTANSGSNTVSFIGERNLTLFRNVSVGAFPTSVAFNPTNGTVYVANLGTGNISVINPGNQTVVSSIGGITSPSYLEFDPNSGMLYVISNSGQLVWVIDPSTGSLYSNVIIAAPPTDVTLTSIASGPAGEIYAVDNSADCINVVNTTYFTYSTIPGGDAPQSVVYDQADGNIFVSDSGSNSIMSINTTTESASSITPYQPAPTGAVYDPANSNIYVSVPSNDTLDIINGTTNIVGSIKVGNTPTGVAVDGQSNTLFVAESGSNVVTFVNAGSGLAFKNVSVGLTPQNLAYDTYNGLLYVADFNSNNVTVIDAQTGKTVTSIPVLSNPYDIALNPYNQIMYVTDLFTSRVSAINTTTNMVVQNLSVGWSPTGIAYYPDERSMVVLDSYSYAPYDGISVINSSNSVYQNQLDSYFYSYNLGGSIAYNPVDKTMFGTIQTSNQIAELTGIPVTNTNLPFFPTITVGAEPATIVTDLSNGLMYVTCPASGTIYVITVGSYYNVSITESGMGNSASWSIEIGSNYYNIKGPSFYDALVNGTYNFAVISYNASYELTGGPSSIVVNGSNLLVMLTFIRLYNVEFNATGLTPGQAWFAAVNNVTVYSYSDSLNLSEGNGTYAYRLYLVTSSNFMSAGSGNITVDGHNLTVNVALSAHQPAGKTATGITYLFISLATAAGAIVLATFTIIRRRRIK